MLYTIAVAGCQNMKFKDGICQTRKNAYILHLRLCASFAFYPIYLQSLMSQINLILFSGFLEVSFYLPLITPGRNSKSSDD